jgi:hypothetical protein
MSARQGKTRCRSRAWLLSGAGRARRLRVLASRRGRCLPPAPRGIRRAQPPRRRRPGPPHLRRRTAQAGGPSRTRAPGRRRGAGNLFLVGEQVERSPQLAAEIAAAGHEVGLHCHRHRRLVRLMPRQVRDDLRRGQAVIAEATGHLPRRYRPPYGVFNAAALALARGYGWEPLLWSSDGRDWHGRATPDSIAARATRGLRGGDVILSTTRTPTALPAPGGGRSRRFPALLRRSSPDHPEKA